MRKVRFILIQLIILFAACEIGLRLFGYKPWPQPIRFSTQSIFDHETLGWQNRQGVYVGRKEGNDLIYQTYWPGGLRATATHQRESSDSTVLLGCSYMQGFGLRDQETFGWQLQEKYPNLNVLNYGTPGYGTCQSFILMKQLFNNEPKPNTVIYGFIGHHEERNVFNPSWTRALSLRTPGKHLRIPYCELSSQGEIKVSPPAAHPVWFLRDRSALVAAVDNLTAKLLSAREEQRRVPVTKSLILELNKLATNAQSRFIVAILEASTPTKKDYQNYLKENGVEVIDCIHPEWPSPALRIPGDLHPNASVNKFWSDCVAAALGAGNAAAP